METSTTFLIATITFLWYRKGRLWNFYDSITEQSKEQILKHSLDLDAWKKLARENSDKLGKELFNSLFRFEIEYLRDKINNIQDLLWIPDSSTDSEKQIDYYDKEKYSKYIIKDTFYKDIRYCGIPLLINALKRQWGIWFDNKAIEDTGFKVTYRKKGDKKEIRDGELTITYSTKKRN